MLIRVKLLRATTIDDLKVILCCTLTYIMITCSQKVLIVQNNEQDFPEHFNVDYHKPKVHY
jgi:hypothetical protein